MCNDFGNHIPYDDYLQAFSQTRIPVKWPNAAPNLQPREDIWPTDKAPVIRRLEDGPTEFTQLRWGFPPGRPKGAPVINFRSEGRRFPKGAALCRHRISSNSPAPSRRSRNGNSPRPASIGSASPGSGGQALPGQKRHSRCSRQSPGQTLRRFTIGRWSSSAETIGAPGSISACPNPICSGRCRWARFA